MIKGWQTIEIRQAKIRRIDLARKDLVFKRLKLAREAVIELKQKISKLNANSKYITQAVGLLEESQHRLSGAESAYDNGNNDESFRKAAVVISLVENAESLIAED